MGEYGSPPSAARGILSAGSTTRLPGLPTPELTRGLHTLTPQTHSLPQQGQEQSSSLALRHSISEPAKAVEVETSRPRFPVSHLLSLQLFQGQGWSSVRELTPECDLNLSCPCFFLLRQQLQNIW